MVLRSITGKIGWGHPVWPSTRRPCTISVLRRQSVGAFFFGGEGAGRADQDASAQGFTHATGLEHCSAGAVYVRLLGYGELDVHFISSLPVMQRTACKAWADTKPVQMVGVVC
jgi:hypothetical protein